MVPIDLGRLSMLGIVVVRTVVGRLAGRPVGRLCVIASVRSIERGTAS